MRVLDRLLLNPNVQRLGGLQAIAGAAVLAWGIVTGVNPVIVIGGFLCAANLAIAAFVFMPRTKVPSLRERLGRRKDGAALFFDSIEVAKSRAIHEDNVFVDDWNGAPVVFNIVNPQGAARARDVRPTVTVKDPQGNVLAGPTNGRWANPQAPKKEEVERDIPANGAPVAIDTVIQEVAGDGFWLVTDEGLRIGLKSKHTEDHRACLRRDRLASGRERPADLEEREGEPRLPPPSHRRFRRSSGADCNPRVSTSR